MRAVFTEFPFFLPFSELLFSTVFVDTVFYRRLFALHASFAKLISTARTWKETLVSTK